MSGKMISGMMLAATTLAMHSAQAQGPSGALPAMTRHQPRKVAAADGTVFATMHHDELGLMVTRPGRFNYLILRAFDADSVVADKAQPGIYHKYYHFHGNPHVTLVVAADNTARRKKIERSQVTERVFSTPLYKDYPDSTKVVFRENAETGLSITTEETGSAVVPCRLDRVLEIAVEDQRRYNRCTGRTL